MARYYALASRPLITDPDGTTYRGVPPGTIGSVDLAPIGGVAYVFVTSAAPFAKADITQPLGDGTTLDIYVLKGSERNSWNTLLGVSIPGGSTLFNALWTTLTSQADPNGLLRAKPIMPTHKGVLELHLGGHSLVKAERLPDDPTMHPAWPNIQAVLQNDYRTLWGRNQELARKWLGANQRKFRLGPEQARDLIVPADLPRVLPLRPTTTITESFNQADSGTLGPDLTWTEVAGTWSTSANKATVSETTDTPVTWTARANRDLSSDDHYAQATLGNVTKDQGGGASVRFDSVANTRYAAAMQSPGFSTRHVRKIIVGVQTALINDTAESAVSGDVVQCRADGSTISIWKNGVNIGSVTDTEITGHLRTGLAGKKNVTLDAFQASDLAAGLTFEEAATLAASAGITSSADQAVAAAIALAASQAIATAIQGTFEPAISLAASQAVTAATDGTFEPSLGLAALVGLAPQATRDSDAAASLPATVSLATASGASFDSSLSLAASAAVASAAAVETTLSAALAAQLGLSSAVAATFEPVVSLAALMAAATDARLTAEPTASLTVFAGFGAGGGAGLGEAVALAAGVSAAMVAGGAFDGAIPLASSLGLSPASQKDMAAAVTLGAIFGLAADEALSVEAAASLVAALGLGGASEINAEAATSLSLAAALAAVGDVEGGAQTYSEAVSLALAGALQSQVGLNAEASVALGVEIGKAVGGVLNMVAGATLSASFSAAAAGGINLTGEISLPADAVVAAAYQYDAGAAVLFAARFDAAAASVLSAADAVALATSVTLGVLTGEPLPSRVVVQTVNLGGGSAASGNLGGTIQVTVVLPGPKTIN